uniref:Serine aminopeptidase S33 domain-containing protein n=1 Tax=Eucampia antarctica TaxID=49252 RepID=A0A7S2W3A1_9STRA|eukprot:CAMPEP_0197825250 /NCGR_PEP_ID=MMETSP1437-20131217/2361_1 /TAXON_ID=49252 ORGANISM="Eucampia antarctica, Strain CCMP1452" /NCGR_SAMPLE_ID=MMETSP1437 /ASSEMBLY_ACC=CAM_ASM_001096 /LENGTH=350 /DNA_ID=CAMNT_0043425173 /DNA_START=103 /DNA_END=1155 /DNA_ORIENTATION=+
MTPCTLWGKDVLIDLKTCLSDEEIAAMDDIMPNMQHGWFKGTDNHWLNYRKFMPPDGQKPKGVLIYQHGIMDHCGVGYKLKDGTTTNYALLGKSLIEEGFAFYVLDMRGHGFSEGLRHYVPDYSVNVNDFDNFSRFVDSSEFSGQDIPLYLGGHSYGGTICLHVSRMWQNDTSKKPNGYRGSLLVAPAIIGTLPAAPVVFVLRYILAPLIPTRTPFFMPNPVSADRIWNNQEVTEHPMFLRTKKINFDGSGRPMRLGTAVSLLAALEDVRDKVIPGFKVPFCVCHGTADDATPISGTDLLDEKSNTPASDKSINKEEGKYHDLLSDVDRQETVSILLNWMNSRLDKDPFN